MRFPVNGRARLGVASTFLGERVRPGDQIKVYVQKAQHFGLPADPSLPIIMIGPGTGIAPFRAFLYERMASKAPGRNWLFFGHQRSNHDFFYEDELTGMKAAGALTRLSLAWSRDGSEKFYVQDRMREVGRDLWAWLADGAHVYVCGDAKRMARDVEGALVEIVAAHGARTTDEAIAFVAEPEEIRPLSAGRVLMPGGRGRSPSPAARRRAWQRSRGCRSSWRSRANARWLPATARPWPGKRSCCRRPAPMSSLFAEHPCAELRAVAAQPPRGAIVLQHRAWRAEDFGGAAVAVGGFDDDREAQRFADAARAAGVPVNVIDKPAYCDFSFGAIVNRSPLVIGISTDGAAPVFAQAIRGKLEAMIPRGFAGWADAARRWRKAVQSSGLSFAARRRFWQAFAGFALAHPDRKPAPIGFRTFLHQTRAEAPAAAAGSITFVGRRPR